MPVQRFILTGTPGAGKTTLLKYLTGLGHSTIAEAATDVIKASQRHDEHADGPDLIDAIVTLQRERQLAAAGTASVQFYDRSPICTYALSVYVGRPISAVLQAEVDRVIQRQVYQRHVFFVRNLGFCQPTSVRRIGFPDALRFERIHEQTYKSFGYRLIHIHAAPVPERLAQITTKISQLTDL